MWRTRVGNKLSPWLPLLGDLIRIVIDYLPPPDIVRQKTTLYTRDESLRMESIEPIDLSDPKNNTLYGWTPTTKREFRAIATLWALFPNGLVLEWSVGGMWQGGFQWVTEDSFGSSHLFFSVFAGSSLVYISAPVQDDIWCEAWHAFLRRSLWTPTGPLIAATNEQYHPAVSQKASRDFDRTAFCRYPNLHFRF
jgi:hypothetical protein